jgi:hypothetical protein
VEVIESQVAHLQERMCRLRKRKQSVTHELNERERTLQKRAIVGSFIDVVFSVV